MDDFLFRLVPEAASEGNTFQASIHIQMDKNSIMIKRGEAIFCRGRNAWAINNSRCILFYMRMELTVGLEYAAN